MLTPPRADGTRRVLTLCAALGLAGADLFGAAAPAPSAGSQFPGIYPVYAESGRWLVLVRPAQARQRPIASGSRFLVIGSRGTDIFRAARASRTLAAACKGHKPAPTPAYELQAAPAADRALSRGSAASKLRQDAALKRVGEPIIAIYLKPGAVVQPQRALFRPLPNELSEESYQLLGEPLRRLAVEEVKAGRFPLAEGDEAARLFASSPDPEKALIKIDFASGLSAGGLRSLSVIVEGTQIGGSYRRCLRLFDGDKPLGPCAPMPHVQMAETPLLSFVAYYPDARGWPFLLAYTPSAPLWGHERWGFQTSRGAAKLFLRDALDPRCRAAF